MEQDYLLISKEELKKLKDENLKLKKDFEVLNSQINNFKKPKSELENKINDNQINEIFKIINVLKEERFDTKSELLEIKELNKKTLNEILTKEDNIGFKLEKIIDNFKIFTNSFDLLVKTNKEEFSKLNLTCENLKNLPSETNNELTIIKKIERIEDFIENLKILLSQVKSSDLKI